MHHIRIIRLSDECITSASFEGDSTKKTADCDARYGRKSKRQFLIHFRNEFYAPQSQTLILLKTFSLIFTQEAWGTCHFDSCVINWNSGENGTKTKKAADNSFKRVFH